MEVPTLTPFEDANVRRWVLVVYLGLGVILALSTIVLAVVGAVTKVTVDLDLTNPLLIWNTIGALLISLKAPGDSQVEQMDVTAENVTATETP